MATSKYLNIELDGKQLKDTKDAIENAFKIVETDINTTNNTISNNKIDIETKLQNHKDSITAHNSDDLLNNSTVEGSKISDALNTLKNKDAELDTRIDNIVAQAGTDNTEIVDARTSTTKNKTFTVLKDRFEELEEETKSLVQHKTSSMPHEFQDNDTGKTYKYGFKQENGFVVFMYEEVI